MRFDTTQCYCCVVLPALNEHGLLPAGVHPASWEEVMSAFGQSSQRGVLLAGLLDATSALALAGCQSLWLDGSFVTAKATPGDYDACWDWHDVAPDLLDPLLLDFSAAGSAARKAKYLGDLFPAGVETGSGLTFVDFFQKTRDGDRKGIVLLNPGELS